MDENRKTSEPSEKNTNSLDFDAKIREIESVIAKYSEKAKSCEAVSPVVESIVSASFKKKMVAMVTVIALSIAMLVGSTYAYFTATTSSGFNRIETGRAEFEFVDLVYPPSLPGGIPTESLTEPISAYPGESVVRNIRAINRGGLSVFVRAKVEALITLDERYQSRSDEIDPSLVLYDINSDAWKARDAFDGYYYYDGILARDAQTPDFINGVTFSTDMGNIYKGATVEVKVTFEIVQATGNGATAFDAVGWPSTATVGGGS